MCCSGEESMFALFFTLFFPSIPFLYFLSCLYERKGQRYRSDKSGLTCDVGGGDGDNSSCLYERKGQRYRSDKSGLTVKFLVSSSSDIRG